MVRTSHDQSQVSGPIRARTMRRKPETLFNGANSFASLASRLEQPPRASLPRAVARLSSGRRSRPCAPRGACAPSARRYTEFVGRESFSVQRPDFIRTMTFRWTAGAFALCIVLFSAFVYWEAADYLLARTDAALTEECLSIAADPPDHQLDAIDDRLRQDPRRIKLAGCLARMGIGSRAISKVCHTACGSTLRFKPPRLSASSETIGKR